MTTSCSTSTWKTTSSSCVSNPAAATMGRPVLSGHPVRQSHQCGGVIQAAHAGGVAQALIAAAAEIQAMIAEQARGAGNLAGQLAQGLFDKWRGHRAILGSKGLPTILGSAVWRSLMTIKGVEAGCV